MVAQIVTKPPVKKKKGEHESWSTIALACHAEKRRRTFLVIPLLLALLAALNFEQLLDSSIEPMVVHISTYT